MQDINLIYKDLPASDRNLFFHGSNEFIEFDDSWKMENIAVACGFFPSLTQARKNGWNGDIPQGFNFKKFGKSKVAVWLNKFQDWKE